MIAHVGITLSIEAPKCRFVPEGERWECQFSRESGVHLPAAECQRQRAEMGEACSNPAEHHDYQGGRLPTVRLRFERW